MPKARGYVRVSTDEQAQNGVSIEAQQKILDAFAIVKGYDDFEIYTDEGFSGKNLNRPAVTKLLSECREGELDAVIVWRFDRLSRSLRDTLDIVEDIFIPNGVSLISVTESIDTSTPSGRMMLNILASFAQHERESDVERVKMAHQTLAKDCRYLGGPVALGYKIVDGYYQIDEATAPIVRKLFDMYIAHEGYTPMLQYLHDMGIRTPNGNEMRKNSLNYILSNEKYIGTYTYNRLASADKGGHRSSNRIKPEEEIIRIPHGIPAIISDEVWAKATEIRNENRTVSGRYNGKETFLLAGICQCAVCGLPLYVNCGGRDKDGTRQRYYVCRNRCIKPARKEDIESATFIMLDSIATQSDILIHACDIANQFIMTEASEGRTEIKPLQARVNALSKKIFSILAFIEKAGADAPASLAADLRRLEEERSGLMVSIERMQKQTPQFDAKQILKRLNAVKNAKEMPPEQVKLLLQAAIARIEVSTEKYMLHLNGNYGMEMRGVMIISSQHRAIKPKKGKYINKSVISVICDTNTVSF